MVFINVFDYVIIEETLENVELVIILQMELLTFLSLIEGISFVLVAIFNNLRFKVL